MMIKEKIAQSAAILAEEGIDLWMTFVRESEVNGDPVLDLILGANCTWHSAFLIPAKGSPVAIVGSLDEARIRETGGYEVVGYKQSIKDALLDRLRRFDPGSIAINYSENAVMADGLSHGLFLTLLRYLEGTPYAGRLRSSESLVAKLRGRKSPEEIRRIRAAVEMAEEIFSRISRVMRSGLTEKYIASRMLDEVDREHLGTAWERELCPAVFTGPESAGAHAGPTDRIVEKGHILNIDFGVKLNEYVSDLQRTWYFLRKGETQAPPEVNRAFETIRDSIALAAERIRPGMEGRAVDAIVRSYITDRGYAEFPHALGHQVGRHAHDGAGLLCPEWERYGNLPYLKIEENQVYTLEPRITVAGYGVATMEEIVVVRADGGEFLSHPQRELYLVP